MDIDAEVLSNSGVNMNSSGYCYFSEFRLAIERGNLEYLEQLYNCGVDLNEMGPDGLCPLHIAAEAGKEDAVLFLLSYGADIDASTTRNETALYFAARERHLEVVQSLLQFGPDVNNEGNKKAIYAAVHPKRTLLRQPVTIGNKTLRYKPFHFKYITATRNVQDMTRFNRREKSIFTSLWEYGFIYELERGCEPSFFHGVIELGYTEIVEDLLKYGADANMEYCEETPLLVAIKTNQPVITALLLFYGADVNAQDGLGDTPIHCAAYDGNVKLVESLLTHGATISDNAKIMNAAICSGSLETVEVLLNRDTIDINDCTIDGITALRASLHEYGNPDITALLLDKGANVNERCEEDEKTPLHYASFCGDHRNCETMLKKGAKVGCKCKFGRTPLHEATTPEMVKILLQYGADINARDYRGRLPLHIASSEGRDTVVDALLKNGADIDARGRNGETALHLSFKPSAIHVCELLLNYGADVNISSKKKSIARFFSVIQDENSIDKEFLVFFIFHIVRMQASNWYVSKEVLQCMRKAQILAQVSEEDLKAERERCEEEIRKLQVKKVQNCNISFGECLTKNISSLALSLNNEHIVQGLKSDDVSAEEFPKYALMLKTKFKKAMQRKALVQQCYEIFGLLTCQIAHFPACCAEAIMDYLSNQDLQMLIAASN